MNEIENLLEQIDHLNEVVRKQEEEKKDLKDLLADIEKDCEDYKEAISEAKYYLGKV